MQKIDYKYFIKKNISIHNTRENRSNSLESKILMHPKNKEYIMKEIYSSLEAVHRTQYYTTPSIADTTNRLCGYFFEYDLKLDPILKILFEIMEFYYQRIFLIIRENRPNQFYYQNAPKHYSEMKFGGSITKVLDIWSNLIRTVLPKSSILLLLLPFREETIFLSGFRKTLYSFILDLNRNHLFSVYCVVYFLYLYLDLFDKWNRINLNSIQRINVLLFFVPNLTNNNVIL